MSFSVDDIGFMHQALRLAEQAGQAGEVPVGAVLVYQGEVIGVGYNQPIGSHDPTAHAEIRAIRQAAQYCQNYRLPDTTLYVTLEPCAMCAGAMVHARIERLVYGAAEPKAGAVDSTQHFFQQPQLNHQVVTAAGCLADLSSQLLSDFFRQRRAEKKLAKSANLAAFDNKTSRDNHDSH